MNKQKTLESLEHSKRSLEFNMQTIKSLLDEKNVASIPSVYKISSHFGKWLYDENNNLKNLLGPIFYKDLDAYNSLWHEEYRKIYIIFFGEPNNSGKIKKNKVSQMDIDKCKLYYSEMQTTTNKLLKALASSKRRLEALAEEKFK